MTPFFYKPDKYLARTGRLDATLVERRVPGAPSFLRGMTTLFVTDTHVLRRTSGDDLAALGARIAGIAPDLLLLGGDYADRAEDAARLFRAWGRLTAPLGVYGVVGNNDREAWDDLNELRAVMAEAGCRLLVNEAVRLEAGGGALWIAGVDEHRHGAPDARGLYPERPAPDAYRVLLSHYPCAPALWPDLMLSGHTHGGQFDLLGVTPYAVGFERLFGHVHPPLTASGLRQFGQTWLLVSKGIGASRIQLRVGVRPEIELLRFE